MVQPRGTGGSGRERRPRASGGAGALRALGLVALAVLGEPLALGVGHLADDQRAGVDLLLACARAWPDAARPHAHVGSWAAWEQGYPATAPAMRDDRRRILASSGGFAAASAGRALFGARRAASRSSRTKRPVAEARALVRRARRRPGRARACARGSRAARPRRARARRSARPPRRARCGPKRARDGRRRPRRDDESSSRSRALARMRGMTKAMSASAIRATTTMAMMTPVDMDLSSRFAIGTTRRPRRETVDP